MADPFAELECSDIDEIPSLFSDSPARDPVAQPDIEAPDIAVLGLDPFIILNEDILRIVLFFLPSLDALNFARTCRLANSLAMPYSLSDVTLAWWAGVGNGYHNRAGSFCTFILSAPGRALHLRKLDMQNLDVCAEALAEIISQADNLEEVYCEDALLSGEPRLTRAIAGRPHLRHLCIGPETRNAEGLQLLSQVCGPLHSLTIAFGRYGFSDPLEYDLSVLGHVASTLQVLELRFPIYATSYLDPSLCLPAVRQVDLRGRVNIGEIHRILPNVHVMRLQDCSFDDLMDQEGHNGLEDKALDKLGLDRYYPQAIGGSVRTLQLRWDPFQSEDGATMLMRTNPIILSCRLDVPSRIKGRLVEHKTLQHVMPRQLPRLKYLEVSIYWGDIKATSWEAKLAEHLSLFNAYELRGFAVHLDHADYEEIIVDVDRVARDIVDTLKPSLTYIGISPEEHRRLKWYRCSCKDAISGRTVIEQLRDWEGELVERELQATLASDS